MSLEQRIKMCLLLEKMHEQKAYSEKLGLEDCSRFHGKRMSTEEDGRIC